MLSDAEVQRLDEQYATEIEQQQRLEERRRAQNVKQLALPGVQGDHMHCQPNKDGSKQAAAQQPDVEKLERWQRLGLQLSGSKKAGRRRRQRQQSQEEEQLGRGADATQEPWQREQQQEPQQPVCSPQQGQQVLQEGSQPAQHHLEVQSSASLHSKGHLEEFSAAVALAQPEQHGAADAAARPSKRRRNQQQEQQQEQQEDDTGTGAAPGDSDVAEVDDMSASQARRKGSKAVRACTAAKPRSVSAPVPQQL